MPRELRAASGTLPELVADDGCEWTDGPRVRRKDVDDLCECGLDRALRGPAIVQLTGAHDVRDDGNHVMSISLMYEK